MVILFETKEELKLKILRHHNFDNPMFYLTFRLVNKEALLNDKNYNHLVRKTFISQSVHLLIVLFNVNSAGDMINTNFLLGIHIHFLFKGFDSLYDYVSS